MLEINLLPWREKKKKQTKIRLYLLLSAIASMLSFFNLYVESYFDHLKEHEAKACNDLKEKLNDLEQLIQKAEIEDSVSKKQKILLRKIIKEISYSRKIISFLYDLIDVLPNNVSLEKIKNQNKKIILAGHFINDKTLLNFLNKIKNKFKKIEIIEFKKSPYLNENHFNFILTH